MFIKWNRRLVARASSTVLLVATLVLVAQELPQPEGAQRAAAVQAASSAPINGSGATLTVRWTQKCDMPGPLYAFDAATLGNKIYAIGGRGKEKGHDRYTYVYDPGKDSWEIKKEPAFPRSNHAVAALGNRIFVFGGNDSPDKAEAYDVDADTWEELAPIPTPRMHVNYSAAAFGGKVYLLGGLQKKDEPYLDTDSNKNEMYDPANNTWAEKAPLPSPRSSAAVTVFENKIYVISGLFKREHTKTVFLYDPATDTWQTRAPMPEARFMSGAAVVKDKIVVITGDLPDQRETKIFVYEPLKDRWTDLGRVPRNFRLAAVASIGDRFYILGGVDLDDHILNQCLEGTLVF